MTDLPTVLETRVRFAETDRQGVVFYGEYFTYLDEAFNAFLREIGRPYDALAADGWTTHVAHAELDYVAAAEFGDVLEHGLRVAAFGRSSVRAEYEARLADTGGPVAEGEVVHVAVDTGSGESIPVPASFRDVVVAFQDRPPDDRESE